MQAAGRVDGCALPSQSAVVRPAAVLKALLAAFDAPDWQRKAQCLPRPSSSYSCGGAAKCLMNLTQAAPSPTPPHPTHTLLPPLLLQLRRRCWAPLTNRTGSASCLHWQTDWQSWGPAMSPA